MKIAVASVAFLGAITGINAVPVIAATQSQTTESNVYNWATILPLKVLALLDFGSKLCYFSNPVSKAGVVSPGLKVSGDVNGGCHDTEQLKGARIFTRCRHYPTFSICIYSAWAPKEQKLPGKLPKNGHTHQWVNWAVTVLRSNPGSWFKNSPIDSVSIRKEGKWETTKFDTKTMQMHNTDDGRTRVLLKLNRHKTKVYLDYASEHDSLNPENGLRRWADLSLVEYPYGLNALEQAALKDPKNFGGWSSRLSDEEFEQDLLEIRGTLQGATSNERHFPYPVPARSSFSRYDEYALPRNPQYYQRSLSPALVNPADIEVGFAENSIDYTTLRDKDAADTQASTSGASIPADTSASTNDSLTSPAANSTAESYGGSVPSDASSSGDDSAYNQPNTDFGKPVHKRSTTDDLVGPVSPRKYGKSKANIVAYGDDEDSDDEDSDDEDSDDEPYASDYEDADDIAALDADYEDLPTWGGNGDDAKLHRKLLDETETGSNVYSPSSHQAVGSSYLPPSDHHSGHLRSSFERPPSYFGSQSSNTHTSDDRDEDNLSHEDELDY